MANWDGKPKAWKRAAEILKTTYGIEASTTWDLGFLNKKLKEAAEKKSAAATTTAEKSSASTNSTTSVAPAKAEVVSLPASQKVDVQAPVMNVNVPAPHVTIHGGKFSIAGAWAWAQAFVIGFSSAYLIPMFLAYLAAH